MAYLKEFLLSLSLLVVAESQGCTPGIVPNITVTSNDLIVWSAALNPSSCVISGYIINIFDLEEGVQFQHQTAATVLSYNLTSLEMCKTYGFEVHALTNQYVIGPSVRINGTIPIAANLNLTLTLGNATLNDSHLSVTWNPNSAIHRCISYYRVVYWDETNNPKDVYVPTDSFTLPEDPVPCMKYNFQVSAVVVNPDIEGPSAEFSSVAFPAVANPPRLVSIITSPTTVNMTWKVPTYSENRCALRHLIVSTLGLPANISTTSFAINDTTLRPDISVVLTGLSPNTVYTSFVSLQNIAGLSKNVTVSYQTSDTFKFNYDTDLIYY